MLRAIISQLLDQDNLLLDHLHREWTSLGDPVDLSDGSVLKEVAKDCLDSQHKVWVMLDGLDECDGDSHTVLEWCLAQVQSPLVTSSGARIRLLVAGQRNGVIDQLLSACPEVRLDRIDSHLRDIEEYTKARAIQLRDRFLLDSREEAEVVERVKDGSKGEGSSPSACPFLTVLYRKRL